MASKTLYNYAISFRGWAQCRLATDPDPDYEPRGVSGYTFALPGEPDMTQIIYFQDGPNVINRSFGPSVGVKVSGGYFYKTLVKSPSEQEFLEKRTINRGHKLFGAKVDLLGDPRFVSHNSTIIYNGYGLVSPFQLQVDNGTGVVSRNFYVNPDQPTDDLDSIPIDDMAPYEMKISLDSIASFSNPVTGALPGSPNMLFESEVLDPVAFRKKRLHDCEKQLRSVLRARPRDPNAIAALKKRIRELKIDAPANRRTQQMATKVLVPYDLNSDTASVNGGPVTVGSNAPWPLEMWLGAWDGDSLCFYVKGNVTITLESDPF